MSILTGEEIIAMRAAGRLTVDPFREEHVNPNSMDLTLADTLLVYTGGALDMRADNPTEEVTIPPEGLELVPGQLYLACTAERVGSREFVAVIEGKSSLGRLGLQIHMTAGFLDLGFGCDEGEGFLTLEMACVLPLRIYAGVRVCQAVFHTTHGYRRRQYVGKYKGQRGPTPSRMWQDFGAEHGRAAV